MEFVIKKADIDYMIYTHIGALANSRGVKIIDKDGSYPMQEHDFASKKDNNKYIIIPADRLTFVQLCRNGDYHKKSKLATLLNKTNSNRVIIIKHSKFNIKEVDFDGEYEILDGDRYLLFDWQKTHAEKGRTTKLIDEDAWKSHILTNFLVEPSELPGIGEHSHEVVLGGHKLGDVLELDGPSLASSGKTIRPVQVRREISN